MQKTKNAFLPRIHVRSWLHAFALGCLSLNATAGMEVLQNGNTKTLVFPSNTIGGSSTYFQVPSPQRTGLLPTASPPSVPSNSRVGGFGVVKTSPNTVHIVGIGDVPIGNSGKKIPGVEVKALVPKAAYGKALSLAGKLMWPVAVIQTAGELFEAFKDEGVEDVQSNGNEITGKILKDIVQTGWLFYHSLGPTGYTSASAACAAFVPLAYPPGAGIKSSSPAGIGGTTTNPTCKAQVVIYVQPDQPSWGTSTHLTENSLVRSFGNSVTRELRPATQQEIEDLIASNSGWPGSAARALATSLNAPGGHVETEPLKVTGPATVPGEKTTTTETVKLNPGTNTIASPGTSPTDTGTKTTTKQDNTKVTYNNNTVTTNSTVTNTTTTITNNVTNVTTTEGTKDEETENKDPPKEEQQSDCEKNPEALMCQEVDLDTPEGEIPKKNREVTLTEENLFGSGSCPADVYFNPSGVMQQLKVWDWNQACGHISTYVKPILILTCTFTAFMILVPGKTE